MRLPALLLALALTACGGCQQPAPTPVPIPIPTPTPPPEPTPTPEPPKPTGLTRETFAAVKPGDALSAVLEPLPPPDHDVTTDGGVRIVSWRLDEARAAGGVVEWQVLARQVDGAWVVSASFAW